jgi:hypothetical protein
LLKIIYFFALSLKYSKSLKENIGEYILVLELSAGIIHLQLEVKKPFKLNEKK